MINYQMPQKMVILTMVNRWWRGDDNKKYDNDVVEEQEDNQVPGSGDGESGGDASETKVSGSKCAALQSWPM